MKNSNHDFHCLDCDEICDVSELATDESGDICCPSCGGDDIVELDSDDFYPDNQ